jgi:hypothetical protein
MTEYNKTDLIIAYYNEYEYLDTLINYANKYNYNFLLYNKSNHTPILKNLKVKYEINKLPNIGQHTHTYLYHIIKNYNNLNDITIFMLGSAFRGRKKTEKAHWVLNNANNCKGIMAKHIWLGNDYDFELPYYDIFNYKKDIINTHSKRVRTKMIRAHITPLGKWIENNTDLNLPNKKFYRSNKCIFAVTKEIILKKPLSYYQNLISQLEAPTINLEVIHYFERAWVSIFLEPDKDENYYEKVLNYDIKKYPLIFNN